MDLAQNSIDLDVGHRPAAGTPHLPSPIGRTTPAGWVVSPEKVEESVEDLMMSDQPEASEGAADVRRLSPGVFASEDHREQGDPDHAVGQG